MIRTLEASTVRIVEEGESLRIETWADGEWSPAVVGNVSVPSFVEAMRGFLDERKARALAASFPKRDRVPWLSFGDLHHPVPAVTPKQKKGRNRK